MFATRKAVRLLGPVLAIGLAGCASAPRMQDGILIDDPYEAQNRRVHDFNKAVDDRVIGPVAHLVKGGGEKAPKRSDGIGAMGAVINVGANLSLPGKIANSLLQGRPGPAIRNFFRFGVNTTVGIGGIFDVAGSDFGLPEADTDFGETLAVWGVPEGAYLELPLLGPSTQRDAFGKLVDLAVDPLWLVLDGDRMAAVYGLRAGSKAGDRARFGDTVDSVLKDSADSYGQTRLIYLMHRRHSVGEEGAEIDPYDDAASGAVPGFIDPYAE